MIAILSKEKSPKCGGNMGIEDDPLYGRYKNCLQCGYDIAVERKNNKDWQSLWKQCDEKVPAC